MAMPLVAPRYTIADLDRFPDDGNRYELVGGALLVTQAPGARHQSVLSRLTMEIGLYLHRETLAFAVTPGVIRVGDDTQLEPDLLVIPERYRNVDWVKVTDWWLAVEVSGAPSRVYDRDFKRPVYLDVGVREVWRLDLKDQAIFVSRPGFATEERCSGRIRWHPPEMPSPLELEVGAIFG